MPPSGYNQNAINAILEITKFEYTKLFYAYKNSELEEDMFLKSTISDLERQIDEDVETESSTVRRNLKVFMTENLKDLVKEIYIGKDKLDRPVINGYAIQKEITQIGNYLMDLKI